MVLKKSQLYSSLWQSCDELRGGMDASQYKDYVLFMLFIKCISDKYADSDDFSPPVTIPEGASFSDMVNLKGKSDIGDKINTQIIQPLIDNNSRLARSDFPDFNDPNKLGEGKAMVDTLTNLISIFQKPELNFSKNRVDHDDILGDAYEYLMRHFATESGKSKGQFYTPSEVSRVIAKVIGISPQNTVASTTVYDPTCGSGSLLLKVAAEAGKHITLEGQEKDVTTAGLARMNMILHDFPTANILSGNTLASPKFKNGEQLRTYDFVVANPPFSDKTWSTGLTPSNDPYQRFVWREPPSKQGDYAYLLHIIRSMKSVGKAACILPHGVLFRGKAEAAIRKQLVCSGYLKGIIGLPANLFYGTSISACILVLDKENSPARKGIFMIDASKGFIKDGNKNRLRERDIHKLVDTFIKYADTPRYARMVPLDEISNQKNDYNLNLPRYIDIIEPEDTQDIDGHLRGGIPDQDINALDAYWQVLPGVRGVLFEGAGRPGYCQLRLPITEVKSTILGHDKFTAFKTTVTDVFNQWCSTLHLKEFDKAGHPKVLIATIAEDLLVFFRSVPLLDAYGVYQHLLDYWSGTMQDDCYMIAADGWVAKTHRIVKESKSGKKKDRGWICDLIPKPHIVARYFTKEQVELDALLAKLDVVSAGLSELAEDHGGEEGVLKDVSTKSDAKAVFKQALISLWNEEDKASYAKYIILVDKAKKHDAKLDILKNYHHVSVLKNSNGNLTLKAIKSRLTTAIDVNERATLTSYLKVDKQKKTKTKEAAELLAKVETQYRKQLKAGPLPENLEDLHVIVRYLALLDKQKTLKSRVKEANTVLDKKAYEKYLQLCVDEIKTLVVEDKWLATLAAAVQYEMDHVSQVLTDRICQLAERYSTPLPKLTRNIIKLSERVDEHLKRMGAVWN